MKKKNRAALLLRLLPTALSLAGVATHASAATIEAPGNRVVSDLASALQNGYLYNAQTLVNLITSCGVRAIVVGDTTLTVQQLDLLITAMAAGDKSSWTEVEAAFQAAGAGATFLTDDANVIECVIDQFDLLKSNFPFSSQ